MRAVNNPEVSTTPLFPGPFSIRDTVYVTTLVFAYAVYVVPAGFGPELHPTVTLVLVPPVHPTLGLMKLKSAPSATWIDTETVLVVLTKQLAFAVEM